jgi:cyclic pyranopterin phosphate synthase
MRDFFGRTIDYLRLSVTDRCPARCVYCMPEEGIEWIDHSEILKFEEFERLIRIMVPLGLKKIKLTGGEPLARRGVVPFISSISRLDGIEKITLTTNAVLLAGELDALRRTKLSAVNVSLNSLDRERYRRISLLDKCEEVQSILKVLFLTGLDIKINCVPIENMNGDDLIPLARLAEKNNIAVRFIELMPLGFAGALKPIPEHIIIERLEKEFGPLTPCDEKFGEGPARYFLVNGFRGRIGFISPLSHQFCGSCNRLRLTSQGFLKPCLSSDMSVNLKEMLRGGSSDGEIAGAIEKIVFEKPASHNFIVDNKINIEEHKPKKMNRIGG